MASQILIAGNQIGLDRAVEPFLLPDQAYPVLENAFVFRERIKRKNGWSFLGRLRRLFTAESVGTTTGSSFNLPDLIAYLSLRTSQPNAEIEIGSITITIDAGGPDETIYEDSVTPGILTYISGTYTGAGTVNYITGQIIISYTVNPSGQDIEIDFGYYPALPCMGLRNFEDTTINDEQTIGFDTIYAYQYITSGWAQLGEATWTDWSGTNADLIWTTNYIDPANGDRLFFATNSVPNDSNPIQLLTAGSWAAYTPIINGSGDVLINAEILIEYQGRLLALNTYEGPSGNYTNFPNRVRFSQRGNVTDTTNGWLDDVPGRGGYNDAPVAEAIVAAEFIKDRLIVYFEQSTFQLVYSSDETFPFFWQRINTELGAESKFSTVPFDNGVLGIGDTGIHTCNGVNVQRIDAIIPDEVFKIKNLDDGPKRVYGIRDYYEEVVYWTYPQFDNDPTYPNRCFLYNYRNNTWAKLQESFTCFGPFQKQTDWTWQTLPYKTWSEWNKPWDQPEEQGLFPQICAGNQQGYTFLLDYSAGEDPSLSVTAFLTSTNITIPAHNLLSGDYIQFSNLLGISGIDEDTIYQVYNVIDANTITINVAVTGTYLGGGEVTIHRNFRVATKQFNPFYGQNKQARIQFVDLYLDSTSDGQFTSNMSINSNTAVSISPPYGTNIYTTAPESPNQQGQDKIWHRKYYSQIAQFISFLFTLSDAQMRVPDIVNSDWVLHAISIQVLPSTRLVP